MKPVCRIAEELRLPSPYSVPAQRQLGRSQPMANVPVWQRLLVINLKAAKALGLTIPQSLRVLAEVIE